MDVDLSMIVSPNGKLYMIRNKIRICSYADNRQSIYYFGRYDNDVLDYINAEMDDGELVLYHYYGSGQRKMIPSGLWRNAERLQAYVWAYFGISSKSTSMEKTLDIDESGEPIQGDEIHIRPCFRITRTDFKIRTTNWRLEFSKFEGLYIDDDERHFSLEVFPTFGVGAFENICNLLEVRADDEIDSDIWFERMVDVKIDMGIALSDNRRISKAICGGVDVVVKRSESSTFKPACLKVWRTNNHNNIRGLRSAQILDGVCYLVFDYFSQTLEELVLKKGSYRSQFIIPNSRLNDLLRGILDGLEYLHESGICHMNLNPYNILATADGVSKLCGFTKAEKYTENRRDEDLRALGKMIMFIYSPRKGSLTEKDYDGKSFDVWKMYDWAEEAKDIASKLQRPRHMTLLEIYHHPSFWHPTRNILFVCEVAQFLNDGSHDSEMRSHKSDYFSQTGWMQEVPFDIMNYMLCWTLKGQSTKPVNKYYSDNPRHLLRFARNCFNHLGDMKKCLGDKDCFMDELAFEYQLHEWFPRLLIGTYNFLGNCIQQASDEDLKKFSDVMSYYPHLRR